MFVVNVCVFCFQPSVSWMLILVPIVRSMSSSGSLTETSVHALPSGMAVAAVTPTALKRKMNVSGHVAPAVSPDCFCGLPHVNASYMNVLTL